MVLRPDRPLLLLISNKPGNFIMKLLLVRANPGMVHGCKQDFMSKR